MKIRFEVLLRAWRNLSSRMSPRTRWLAGGGVLVLAGLLLFWFLRSENAPADGGGRDGRPVSVVLANARIGDLDVVVNALGTVTALNTVNVRARVDGQLQRILFREGQLVRAGEVLAEIDPRPFQIAVDQAKGQLLRDQAQLNNAQIDLARYQGLLARDAVSRQQLDTQSALVQQYEGLVRVDQAQVDSALLQLDFSHIRAPVSGRIGLRLVDVGNMVKSGDATGLVVLTQTQPIAVVFALPSETFATVLEHWLEAQRQGSSLLVEAWSRDNKTRLAGGKLLTVDNQMDTSTGTVKMKAIFDNADHVLFPNQFVNVRLRAEIREEVVLVPEAAIQRGTQGEFVYVLNAQETPAKETPKDAPKEEGPKAAAPAQPPEAVTAPKDGNKEGGKAGAKEGEKPPLRTVSMRVVKTGPSKDGLIVVEQGLQAGEQVVTDGLDKLRQGAKVMVIEPGRKGGAGRGGGKPRDGAGAKDKSGEAGDKDTKDKEGKGKA